MPVLKQTSPTAWPWAPKARPLQRVPSSRTRRRLAARCGTQITVLLLPEVGGGNERARGSSIPPQRNIWQVEKPLRERPSPGGDQNVKVRFTPTRTVVIVWLAWSLRLRLYPSSSPPLMLRDRL